MIKERGRKISARKNRPAAVGIKMGKPSLPDDARIPLVSSPPYWLIVAPRKRRTLHSPVIAAPASLFLVEIPLSQMIVQTRWRSSCGEQLYRDAIVDPAASFKPEVRNPNHDFWEACFSATGQRDPVMCSAGRYLIAPTASMGDPQLSFHTTGLGRRLIKTFMLQ